MVPWRSRLGGRPSHGRSSLSIKKLRSCRRKEAAIIVFNTRNAERVLRVRGLGPTLTRPPNKPQAPLNLSFVPKVLDSAAEFPNHARVGFGDFVFFRFPGFRPSGFPAISIQLHGRVAHPDLVLLGCPTGTSLRVWCLSFTLRRIVPALVPAAALSCANTPPAHLHRSRWAYCHHTTRPRRCASVRKSSSPLDYRCRSSST
jgi:hypothetical protein